MSWLPINKNISKVLILGLLFSIVGAAAILTAHERNQAFAQTVTQVGASGSVAKCTNLTDCADAINYIEALWVFESEGLLQILTVTGKVMFEIPINDPLAAADLNSSKGSVWVLTQAGELSAFNTLGELIKAEETGKSFSKQAQLIARTGSIWVFDDGELSVYDAETFKQSSSTSVDYPIQLRNSFASQNSVWVVQPEGLAQMDEFGELSEIKIRRKSVKLAIAESDTGNVWITRQGLQGEEIERYNANGKRINSYNTGVTHGWTSGLADGKGLWLLSDSEFAYLNERGEFSFILPAFLGETPNRIVSYVVSQKSNSIWLASERKIHRYTTQGILVESIGLELGDGLTRTIHALGLEQIFESTSGYYSEQIQSQVNPNGAKSTEGNFVFAGSSNTETAQTSKQGSATDITKGKLNKIEVARKITPILYLLLLGEDNKEPIITSSPVTTVKLEQQYAYQVEATDENDDPLEYQLVTAPAGMQIASDTGLVTWVPSSVGDFDVQIQVIDNKGGLAQQSFTLSVTQNEPPQISSTPPETIIVDQPYEYQLEVSDSDDSSFSFALLDAPSGMRIDPISGLVTWAPYRVGSYDVEIQVSDPIGATVTQAYRLEVLFKDEDLPPVMDPIGDFIAPLGQTTRLNIFAADDNGEQIRYSLSPLPLPEGMILNEVTGAFEYRPVTSDVGSRAFTFTASDGRFQSSQVVQITVPEQQNNTRLKGQTLLPDGTGLPGVRFEMGGQQAVSDINGDFLIENIAGSGRLRFIVDGSGVDPLLGTFATIPEMFDMVEGVENHLHAPVYLMPLDIASADDVDPYKESKITSADVIIDGINYGPIEITIAPETAEVDATGDLFDDIISISRIPDAEFGPAPMPEDIGLSLYIAVQPFGVRYSTPAKVSFPNVEGFPVGTIVDILGLNHDTGAFEKTGDAQVSADGTRVESIGGAVFNNSWHGFTPRPPDPTPPPDDCDCDKGGPAASTYGVKTGNFSDDHSTVPYFSLGQARNLNFVYNSKWANPSPILNFDTLAGLPPPVAMSQKLLVGGIETDEVFIKPGDLGTALTGSALNAIQFNAREFLSGIYSYEYVIDCHFPISRRAGRAQGDVVIINESQSPFGAGWSISNFRKLHIAPDRSKVAMDLGSGNFWLFKKNAQGEFEAPPGHYSSLVENNDASFTVTTKSGMVYQFNAIGLQTSMADRNGNTTDYAYDSQDRLTKVTDPTGLETKLAYIGNVLSTVTDAANRVTRFEHDAEGNLVKITDPDDSYRTFSYAPDTNLMVAKTDKRRFESTIVYDQHDRFQSATLPDGTVRQARPQDIAALPDLRNNAGTMQDLAPTPPSPGEIDSGYTDGNGNAMSYKMTNSGYLSEKTDAVGRTTTYERDADNNPIRVTRPNGSVVARTFDADGNVLTETEEFNGATTTYTYDSFSQVTSVKDALDRVTIMERDVKGNLIRQENALGHQTLIEYNAQGQVTKATDPNGLVTTLAYNVKGLLETKTETPPIGAVRVTSTIYNSEGLASQVTTPDDIVQAITYDSLNRPIKIQNQLNEAQVSQYDNYGNIIETKVLNEDGSTATTATRTYDQRNRLIEVSRPHANNTFSVNKQEYDNNSNLKKTTDPDGKTTQYFYDGENRTIQTIQPDGGIVSYEYDLRDQVTKVQAANDATTSYEYDVLARKLAENSPDRGRWEWAYNIVNNVTTQTDNRGVVVTYQYDLLDRLSTKAYPTPTENVTYAYDSCSAGVGRLCDRLDDSGSYSYAFDVFGNVLSHQKQELGVTYTTSYQYDLGNNTVASTYPTGRTVQYQRDAVRRLAGITSNGQTVVDNFQYRGDSNLIARSWDNGLNETRGYDQQGRITQISLGSMGNRDYQYDASSNITQINSPFQAGLYDYDQNDRLKQENLNGNQTTDFQYDLNGNRITKLIDDAINGNQAESYVYEPQSNKLLNTEAVAPDGSNTETDQRTYQYNDANRVRSITIDNTVAGTYYYNDLGLRTRKSIPLQAGGTQTTVYHYNLQGTLIAETSDSGQGQKDYIWNGMEPIAQVKPNVGFAYLHSDHLYTARIATDELQTVVWQWESDAFGETDPQLETREVNLRFPGQYDDAESGLYYNWNRYYDAGLGRYVTSDPIGLSGGLNTYGYVGGNPMIGYDPLGLYPKCTTYTLGRNFIEREKTLKTTTHWKFGIEWIITGSPSVGPNLDPRYPRKFPLGIGLRFELWKTETLFEETKQYMVYQTILNLLDICRETRKDECGKDIEYRWEREYEKALDPSEILLSTDTEIVKKLLYLMGVINI